MANQYGQVPATYQKCADPECNNMLRLTPCAIKKGTKYCSNACAKKRAAQPRKYSPEDLQWIRDNHDKKTREQMAEHFGTTREAFVKMLYLMRQAGEDIPTHDKGNNKPRKSPVEKQRAVHIGKPAVAGTLKRKNPVFPTRVIKQEGLIPVVFNDKNKTRFMARDEEHAARIRSTYAYLNKDGAERIREQR